MYERVSSQPREDLESFMWLIVNVCGTRERIYLWSKSSFCADNGDEDHNLEMLISSVICLDHLRALRAVTCISTLGLMGRRLPSSGLVTALRSVLVVMDGVSADDKMVGFKRYLVLPYLLEVPLSWNHVKICVPY